MIHASSSSRTTGLVLLALSNAVIFPRIGQLKINLLIKLNSGFVKPRHVIALQKCFFAWIHVWKCFLPMLFQRCLH